MPDLLYRPLPLVTSAILQVIISALWFNSPVLFAQRWLQGIGKTAEQVAEAFSPIKMLYALLAALLLSWSIDNLIFWAGAHTPLAAALVGGLVGGLISAANSSTRAVFESRPSRLVRL